MTNLYLALAGLAGGAALLLAGGQLTAHSPAARLAADPAFTITLAPTPPHDLAPGSDPVKLAEFAWAEFFALNWQASYPRTRLRDAPDSARWSYRDKDATLAVWETYGHRAELRPYSNQMLPFDQAPHYSYRTTPQPAQPTDQLTLFDNLDENSEIGSCVMYGQVPDSVPGGKSMVLYQAKVNRAEYEYVRTTYPTRQQLYQATQRTARNIGKFDAYYNPDTLGDQYKGRTCACPPGVICLPCGDQAVKGDAGVGAIEIKTAWRRLRPSDDPARFLTRKVIYYTQQTSGSGPTADTLRSIYHNETFALVGMHIIHKTRNYPDFVFATWEHVDVQQQERMGYQLLDGAGYLAGGLHYPFPRLHPITPVADAATAAAHARLRALNPRSVLLNYRLVGVQGTPTSNPATPNFYLANYVVESDSTLANFHGSGIGLPHDEGTNTLYLGKRLSAGGCQGCHGVAQFKLGTDFSFLLDNVGKPVRFPDPAQAQYPPAPTARATGGSTRTILFSSAANGSAAPGSPPAGKLGRYVRATQ